MAVQSKNRKRKRGEKVMRWSMSVAGVSFCILCGCPDTSYQAPLPDYSNMSDGGSLEDEDAEYTPPTVDSQR